MDQRFKEIVAATDMIIADWERVRPPTCHDAVELSWRLRKLQIARELLAAVADVTAAPSFPRSISRPAHSFALYRGRVE